MMTNDLKADAHEQISEVVMALLTTFNTVDVNSITPFVPAINSIMELPRSKRISVGVGLIESFYKEHAVDIANSSIRRDHLGLIPLVVWSIDNVGRELRKELANRDAPIPANGAVAA